MRSFEESTRNMLDLAAVPNIKGQSHLPVIVDPSHATGKRWLVRFVGVVDRTAAEKLTNAVLQAEPIDVDGDDDALWVHELIGSRVVDQQGVDRGTCVAVIDNPAHDILELDSGALIPVIFIVSCRDGVAIIDPPDGLFDL